MQVHESPGGSSPMTEAPARMRAVATMDTIEAARGQGAQPRLKRRPGYLGAVHVAQLMLVQVVLFGVLAAVAKCAVVAGVTAAAGAALLIVALLRVQGPWWGEPRAMPP